MAVLKRPSLMVCAAATLACASIALSAQQPKPAAPAAAQAGTTAPGVYTEAQAARGDALYAENCAQCHRPDLTGGELAPALTGPGFVARWTMKPLAEVYDYMRTEMPLNSPGGLSAQQNVDMLSFLLKKSGYAAGKTDLPASSEKLAGIKLPAR
jgi:mono/diheme cytochrome c family protein